MFSTKSVESPDKLKERVLKTRTEKNGFESPKMLSMKKGQKLNFSQPLLLIQINSVRE